MGIVIKVPISDESLNDKLIVIMLSVSFEKPWRMKRTILIGPYIAYFQTEQGLNSLDIWLLNAWCCLGVFRRAGRIISYAIQFLSKLSEVSEA